jgi:hypothetical protein
VSKSLLCPVRAAASWLEAVDNDIDGTADGGVAGVDADGAFVLRNDVAADDGPDKRELIAEHAVDVCLENKI